MADCAFDSHAAPPPGEWKFRALSSAVAEAVITLDRQGLVREWNPAAESLFGHSASEAAGQDLLRLVGFDRESEALPPAAGGRSDGEAAAKNFGFVARRKSGERFRVDMRLFDPGAAHPDEVLAVVHNPIGGPPGQAAQAALARRREERAEALLRQQENDRRLIWQLMHYDPLTGLPNRLLAMQEIDRAMALAARRGRRVAVLVVAVRHFGLIDDTLGHAAGDYVLTTVAARLAQSVAHADTVGRLDGAEFAVLLPDLWHGSEAESAAQRLLGAIAEPITIACHDLVLAANIGISVFPEDGSDPDILLDNASAALRLAQEDNSWQLYAAEYNALAMERLALEEDLRRALRRSEFELHYQPQVDLGSGEVDGAEALVRWRRPGHGLVSPARFIPLAEETGLIQPIGEWVLQTACMQLGAWRQGGAENLRMAVNLSARQFKGGDLALRVPDIVRRHGIGPQSLELEITESILMDNLQTSSAMLRKLRRQGVRLAIDDFGTGYSSLNYLKRFPVNTLKIDQSFVRQIPDDDSDVAIVRAVISLAHGLRLEVVAEGVETAAQLGFMRAHGCDKVQGYFFSPPVSADGFERLLAASPLPQPS